MLSNSNPLELYSNQINNAFNDLELEIQKEKKVSINNEELIDAKERLLDNLEAIKTSVN